MTYSYTFNLKSPSSKTPSLIFLRASIKGSGKYLKYSTGEKILPKNWDSETKFPIRLKGRSNDAVQINSVIKQLTRYGESFQLICSRLEAQGIDLDVDRIRKELDHEFKKDTVAPGSFEAVFDEFLSEKRDLGKIAPQTVQRYETFGANLGSLTREVFNLQVTKSGFYSMILEQSENFETYEEMYDFFQGHLGEEAIAIIRSILNSRK